MDFKKMVLAGSVASLVLIVTTMIYSYTKATNLYKMITSMVAMFGGAAPEIPFMPFVIAEWYLLVAMAGFTSLGAMIKSMIAEMGAYSSMITPFLPNAIYFYVFALVSGLVAGFLVFKKEDDFKVPAAAAVIPAALITAFMWVITFQGKKEIEKLGGTSGLPFSLDLLVPKDYAFIFAVTAVTVGIGLIAGFFIKKKIAK